ncbi:MAG: gliding motility-associated C-terminal domain-containing protein [Flammeovirgaceae bacterium]
MRVLKIIASLVIVLLVTAENAWSTHIRAGCIALQRIDTGNPNSLTYNIIVDLYRDTQGVQFQSGEVDFGDGTVVTLNEGDYVLQGTVGTGTEHFQVVLTHVYPSAARYTISFFERNRNESVCNMFASGQTPFYIESEFLVSPFLGFNRTPQLLLPPIDRGVQGQRYIYNPGAFDADGDSLSFELTVPKQSQGLEVINYRSPNDLAFSIQQENGDTPPIFAMDPISGDLIWDAPENCTCTRFTQGNEVGEYNVAFYVVEWRDGVPISRINCDMQIIITCEDNDRPELFVPNDTCVIAGNSISDTIRAVDPNNDLLLLQAFLPLDSMKFDVLGLQPPNGEEAGVFSWETTCEDVRIAPYPAFFRTQELNNTGLTQLSDIKIWNITVVGPSPEGLVSSVDQPNASITLDWSNYACADAADSMTIWRRRGSFDFTPDVCQTGLPDFTGYQKIGAVPIGTTTFIDNNNGEGLERGSNYCYRIVAVFNEDGSGFAESLTSIEVCEFIESVAPYPVEVSVQSTAQTIGSIQVTWTKPINVDEVTFPKPWTYQLARATGLTGTAGYVNLGQTFAEDDTTFLDTNLNTEDEAYNYRILFFSNGNLVDSSLTASSVRLAATPAVSSIQLTWNADVPWNNTDANKRFHYIYREDNDNPGTFNLIDSVDVIVNGLAYLDDGSFNGEPLEDAEQYCYFVTTVGSYDFPQIRDSLPNDSQEICAIVLDSVPPCPPILSLEELDCSTLQQELPIVVDPITNEPVNCDEVNLYDNELSWVDDLSAGCEQDIQFYRLYFSEDETSNFTLLLDSILEMDYIHDSLTNVAICYYVTAVDDFGNESAPSNIVCNQNCPFYELPNAFSPNNDGINDVYMPIRCPRFVAKVEFSVYNRWGDLVYQSDDNINLDWDGRNRNGSVLPTGTYYYHAKVFFNTFDAGDFEEERKGTIQLLLGGSSGG